MDPITVPGFGASHYAHLPDGRVGCVERQQRQLASIDELEAQERDLVLERATCIPAGPRAADVEGREERELPIVIQIRAGAGSSTSAALPGSTASNDQWAAAKARLTETFRTELLAGEAAPRTDGQDVHSAHTLSPDLYQAHGGAFRFAHVASGSIGSVVVSGLPQIEDHCVRRRATQAVPRERAERGGDSVEQLTRSPTMTGTLSLIVTR
jgi:uncharacterized protein (UPF0303 family)